MLLSQAPLAIAAMVVAVFLFFIDPALVATPLFLSGLLGVLALAGAAAFVPWRRLPDVCACIIPLLDFFAIAALVHGASPNLNGVSLLSAFPVLWLAWSEVSATFTRIMAFAGPLFVAWSPFIFQTAEPSRAALLKPIMVPLIILALGTAATIVTRSVRTQAEALAASRAESEQRARELNTILNVADVGVVMVDQNGHDRLMNTQQKLIHARAAPAGNPDPNERQLLVFGGDRKTLVDPESRPVRRAVKGEAFSGELFWLGSGAEQRAYTTAARQIIDEQGQRHGAVVVFHDTTDVMLALAAQEEFVASVSHELRTPLTSILGYVELAQLELEDAPAGAYLSVVSRNAERLLSLVNDLLGSARDGMKVSKTRGNITEVLCAAVEAARPRAEAAGIHVDVSAADSCIMDFDPVRMAQAVDNLLSNALKFSPPAGTVTVVGEKVGTGYKISVSDNGVGMSAQEQEQLFTRFYRTESARAAAIPGAGLGLAITKSIVDAHGGTLGVVSAPGAGSTFSIELPQTWH